MGNIVLWVLPALHLIICAVIFAMMRLNKLRTRHVIFPAVVLLPVCGYMLLFIDEWQARHSGQALRDVEEYGRTQGEAVWRR